MVKLLGIFTSLKELLLLAKSLIDTWRLIRETNKIKNQIKLKKEIEDALNNPNRTASDAANIANKLSRL